MGCASSKVAPEPDQPKPPRRRVDYSSVETIWAALAEETKGAGPNVRLLRASWVMKQSRIEGARLARRQDLPEEAFISLAELKAMYDMSDNHGHGNGPKYAPVIALSHFWRTKKHPVSCDSFNTTYASPSHTPPTYPF